MLFQSRRKPEKLVQDVLMCEGLPRVHGALDLRSPFPEMRQGQGGAEGGEAGLRDTARSSPLRRQLEQEGGTGKTATE